MILLQKFRIAGKCFQLSPALFKIRKHFSDLLPEFCRVIKDGPVGEFVDYDVLDEFIAALEQFPAVPDVTCF